MPVKPRRTRREPWDAQTEYAGLLWAVIGAGCTDSQPFGPFRDRAEAAAFWAVHREQIAPVPTPFASWALEGAADAYWSASPFAELFEDDRG